MVQAFGVISEWYSIKWNHPIDSMVFAPPLPGQTSCIRKSTSEARPSWDITIGFIVYMPYTCSMIYIMHYMYDTVWGFVVASPVPSLDVNPSTVNVGTATSTTWEALILGLNNRCTCAAFLAAPVWFEKRTSDLTQWEFRCPCSPGSTWPAADVRRAYCSRPCRFANVWPLETTWRQVAGWIGLAGSHLINMSARTKLLYIPWKDSMAKRAIKTTHPSSPVSMLPYTVVFHWPHCLTKQHRVVWPAATQADDHLTFSIAATWQPWQNLRFFDIFHIYS